MEFCRFLLFPLILTASEVMVSHWLPLTWEAPHGPFWHLVTAASALVALFSWRVALGVVPTFSSRTALACAQGVAIALTWWVMWWALPAWRLLWVAGLVFFLPTMAWRWAQGGWRAAAAGAALTWAACWLALGALMLLRPWRWVRLREFVWPALPDVQGRHFEWAQLVQTLDAVQSFGPSGAALPSVLADWGNGWWLRLGLAWGWWSMVLAAFAVVLGWLGLARWMARTPVGPHWRAPTRRLAVGLALFHALAAVLYATWSMGLLYIPLGGLPPMGHAGWWVLTATLAWFALCSWRGRASKQTADCSYG